MISDILFYLFIYFIYYYYFFLPKWFKNNIGFLLKKAVTGGWDCKKDLGGVDGRIFSLL